MDNKIIIICKTENGDEITIKIDPNETIEKLICKIIKKIKHCKSLNLYLDNKLLNRSLKLYQAGLKNKSFIYTKDEIKVIEEGLSQKEINIQFLYNKNPNIHTHNSDVELTSLLKLCLLKEIAHVIDIEKLSNLPYTEKIILEILKNGYAEPSLNLKDDIVNILERIDGSNIINFSKYVDNNINSERIKYIMNLLQRKEYIKINEIKNRLSKYEENIKLFDKTFQLSMKNSIFEFSIVSLVVIDRDDYHIYQDEKIKCPNKVEKILYHGTTIDSVSSILTSEFWKSEKKHYQHGKGVYFTSEIDYCNFYGGKTNRANANIIPNIDDEFTMIACSIYYDKNGFHQVENEKYTPKKNEINYAIAKADLTTVKKGELNKTRFYGKEYVIYELCQICPFLGIKLKRVEYCFIWRDNNFSIKPQYFNKFDKIFKDFLSERKKYIEEFAEYNIYTCKTSEEALSLIERKKYNKIILISNIGSDESGRIFVEDARKIIGNDVIVLFLTYNIENHLRKVDKYKNALISNDPIIYEKYLQCFSSYDIENKILDLKEELEEIHNVKFNFNNDFLRYPLYKKSGNYSKLEFDKDLEFD